MHKSNDNASNSEQPSLAKLRHCEERPARPSMAGRSRMPAMPFKASTKRILSPTLIMLGAGLLAADPLRWLLGTWTDATYNPQGLWIAALVLGLAAWSYTSTLLPEAPGSQRYAYGLLLASAVVRLAGQLLRVNVIGAVTLALDVYALSIIAGLPSRRRPLSPGWLAVLFALSLPLERIVQRLLGYGLQQFSADGACALLRAVGEPVQCIGTRILLAGQDLLVDLPCSGARGLTLLLTLFAALAAVRRPTVRQALLGFVLTLAVAFAANSLRIALLAVALAHPEMIGGASAMDAPWHEGIGLVTLVFAASVLLAWARFCGSGLQPQTLIPLRGGQRPLPQDLKPSWAWPRAVLFPLAALLILFLPARPVDVARAIAAPRLPATIGGLRSEPVALLPQEQAYFTRYGGGAARAAYGPNALLLVSTTAPLRHLHAPDECLRGAGHSVRYVGLAHDALPTAIYRSTDPDGRAWRVNVSYVSDRGEAAASVAEAVWRWMQAPGTRWTSIQRISPWDQDIADTAAWDVAVARSLDLPLRPSTDSRVAPLLHLAAHP